MSKHTPGLLSTPLTASTFRDGQWMNEVLLYGRLFKLLNSTRRATRALQCVWKAHATTSPNLPTSTWVAVPMGAVDVDPDGYGITSGGFAAPAAGLYMVAATGAFSASNAGNRRIVAVGVNSSSGGNADGPRVDESPATTGTSTLCLATPSAFVSAAAGDIITVDQWQDSGATITAGPNTVGFRASLAVWRWA